MHIDLKDYTYELPEDRIAKEPLANRADSKLLHYSKGDIAHYQFGDITTLLPEGAQLVFNDTRVIPARLHFTKDTGALIEIFLLEPVAPIAEIASAMTVTQRCTWKCMVGNLKKWKDGQTLSKALGQDITLEARIVDRQLGHIELAWHTAHDFAFVVEESGKIPLPPYINREVTIEDYDRYQTVYNRFKGAVAAPTAGLHFDEQIISKLTEKGHQLDYVTLHVSAGTFQPVKTENALDHDMHSEQIIINRQTIEHLLSNTLTVAVGTTAMRTLESLYWYGVEILKGNHTFAIEKLAPYREQSAPSKTEALRAVLAYMDANKLESIHGNTEIFIVPGYDFKICKSLITNYHLPASTLILLVAAFIGKENWERVYAEALKQQYRFLSYGDSSLLIP